MYASRDAEFYGSFVDGAWFHQARWLVNHLALTNAAMFTILVIVLQVTVAILIFTRGDLATVALFAGAGIAALAALASNPSGTAGNLALAIVQVFLTLARIQ